MIINQGRNQSALFSDARLVAERKGINPESQVQLLAQMINNDGRFASSLASISKDGNTDGAVAHMVSKGIDADVARHIATRAKETLEIVNQVTLKAIGESANHSGVLDQVHLLTSYGDSESQIQRTMDTIAKTEVVDGQVVIVSPARNHNFVDPSKFTGTSMYDKQMIQNPKGPGSSPSYVPRVLPQFLAPGKVLNAQPGVTTQFQEPRESSLSELFSELNSNFKLYDGNKKDANGKPLPARSNEIMYKIPTKTTINANGIPVYRMEYHDRAQSDRDVDIAFDKTTNALMVSPINSSKVSVLPNSFATKGTGDEVSLAMVNTQLDNLRGIIHRGWTPDALGMVKDQNYSGQMSHGWAQTVNIFGDAGGMGHHAESLVANPNDPAGQPIEVNTLNRIAKQAGAVLGDDHFNRIGNIWYNADKDFARIGGATIVTVNGKEQPAISAAAPKDLKRFWRPRDVGVGSIPGTLLPNPEADEGGYVTSNFSVGNRPAEVGQSLTVAIANNRAFFGEGNIQVPKGKLWTSNFDNAPLPGSADNQARQKETEQLLKSRDSMLELLDDKWHSVEDRVMVEKELSRINDALHTEFGVRPYTVYTKDGAMPDQMLPGYSFGGSVRNFPQISGYGTGNSQVLTVGGIRFDEKGQAALDVARSNFLDIAENKPGPGHKGSGVGVSEDNAHIKALTDAGYTAGKDYVGIMTISSKPERELSNILDYMRAEPNAAKIAKAMLDSGREMKNEDGARRFSDDQIFTMMRVRQKAGDEFSVMKPGEVEDFIEQNLHKKSTGREFNINFMGIDEGPRAPSGISWDDNKDFFNSGTMKWFERALPEGEVTANVERILINATDYDHTKDHLGEHTADPVHDKMGKITGYNVSYDEKFTMLPRMGEFTSVTMNNKRSFGLKEISAIADTEPQVFREIMRQMKSEGFDRSSQSELYDLVRMNATSGDPNNDRGVESLRKKLGAMPISELPEAMEVFLSENNQDNFLQIVTESLRARVEKENKDRFSATPVHLDDYLDRPLIFPLTGESLGASDSMVLPSINQLSRMVNVDPETGYSNPSYASHAIRALQASDPNFQGDANKAVQESLQKYNAEVLKKFTDKKFDHEDIARTTFAGLSGPAAALVGLPSGYKVLPATDMKNILRTRHGDDPAIKRQADYSAVYGVSIMQLSNRFAGVANTTFLSDDMISGRNFGKLGITKRIKSLMNDPKFKDRDLDEISIEATSGMIQEYEDALAAGEHSGDEDKIRKVIQNLTEAQDFLVNEDASVIYGVKTGKGGKRTVFNQHQGLIASSTLSSPIDVRTADKDFDGDLEAVNIMLGGAGKDMFERLRWTSAEERQKISVGDEFGASVSKFNLSQASLVEKINAGKLKQLTAARAVEIGEQESIADQGMKDTYGPFVISMYESATKGVRAKGKRGEMVRDNMGLLSSMVYQLFLDKADVDPSALDWATKMSSHNGVVPKGKTPSGTWNKDLRDRAYGRMVTFGMNMLNDDPEANTELYAGDGKRKHTLQRAMAVNLIPHNMMATMSSEETETRIDSVVGSLSRVREAMGGKSGAADQSQILAVLQSVYGAEEDYETLITKHMGNSPMSSWVDQMLKANDADPSAREKGKGAFRQHNMIRNLKEMSTGDSAGLNKQLDALSPAAKEYLQYVTKDEGIPYSGDNQSGTAHYGKILGGNTSFTSSTRSLFREKARLLNEGKNEGKDIISHLKDGGIASKITVVGEEGVELVHQGNVYNAEDTKAIDRLDHLMGMGGASVKGSNAQRAGSRGPEVILDGVLYGNEVYNMLFDGRTPQELKGRLGDMQVDFKNDGGPIDGDARSSGPNRRPSSFFRRKVNEKMERLPSSQPEQDAFGRNMDPAFQYETVINNLLRRSQERFGEKFMPHFAMAEKEMAAFLNKDIRDMQQPGQLPLLRDVDNLISFQQNSERYGSALGVQFNRSQEVEPMSSNEVQTMFSQVLPTFMKLTAMQAESPDNLMLNEEFSVEYLSASTQIKKFQNKLSTLSGLGKANQNDTRVVGEGYKMGKALADIDMNDSASLESFAETYKQDMSNLIGGTSDRMVNNTGVLGVGESVEQTLTPDEFRRAGNKTTIKALTGSDFHGELIRRSQAVRSAGIVTKVANSQYQSADNLERADALLKNADTGYLSELLDTINPQSGNPTVDAETLVSRFGNDKISAWLSDADAVQRAVKTIKDSPDAAVKGISMADYEGSALFERLGGALQYAKDLGFKPRSHADSALGAAKNEQSILNLPPSLGALNEQMSADDSLRQMDTLSAAGVDRPVNLDRAQQVMEGNKKLNSILKLAQESRATPEQIAQMRDDAGLGWLADDSPQVQAAQQMLSDNQELSTALSVDSERTRIGKSQGVLMGRLRKSAENPTANGSGSRQDLISRSDQMLENLNIYDQMGSVRAMATEEERGQIDALAERAGIDYNPDQISGMYEQAMGMRQKADVMGAQEDMTGIESAIESIQKFTGEMSSLTKAADKGTDSFKQQTRQMERVVATYDQFMSTVEKLPATEAQAAMERNAGFLGSAGEIVPGLRSELSARRASAAFDPAQGMDEDQKQSVLSDFLSRRGAGGERARDTELFRALREEGLDFMGGKVKGDNLDTLGSGMRLAKSAQGVMFSVMMARNNLIDPIMGQIDQSEKRRSSNFVDQHMAGVGTDVFAEDSPLAAFRSRMFAQSQFSAGMQDQQANTYGALGTMGGRGLGRLAGIAQSILAPTVTGAMLGNAMGPVGGVVGAGVGFAIGTGAAALSMTQSNPELAADQARMLLETRELKSKGLFSAGGGAAQYLANNFATAANTIGSALFDNANYQRDAKTSNTTTSIVDSLNNGRSMSAIRETFTDPSEKGIVDRAAFTALSLRYEDKYKFTAGDNRMASFSTRYLSGQGGEQLIKSEDAYAGALALGVDTEQMQQAVSQSMGVSAASEPAALATVDFFSKALSSGEPSKYMARLGAGGPELNQANQARRMAGLSQLPADHFSAETTDIQRMTFAAADTRSSNQMIRYGNFGSSGPQQVASALAATGNPAAAMQVSGIDESARALSSPVFQNPNVAKDQLENTSAWLTAAITLNKSRLGIYNGTAQEAASSFQSFTGGTVKTTGDTVENLGMSSMFGISPTTIASAYQSTSGNLLPANQSPRMLNAVQQFQDSMNAGLMTREQFEDRQIQDTFGQSFSSLFSNRRAAGRAQAGLGVDEQRFLLGDESSRMIVGASESFANSMSASGSSMQSSGGGKFMNALSNLAPSQINGIFGGNAATASRFFSQGSAGMQQGQQAMVMGATAEQAGAMTVGMASLSTDTFNKVQGVMSGNPLTIARNFKMASSMYNFGAQGITSPLVSSVSGFGVAEYGNGAALANLTGSSGAPIYSAGQLQTMNSEFRSFGKSIGMQVATDAGYFSGVSKQDMAGGIAGLQKESLAVSRAQAGFGLYATRVQVQAQQALESGGGSLDSRGFSVGGNLDALDKSFARTGLKLQRGNGMTMYQVQDAQTRLQREQQDFSYNQESQSLDMAKEGKGLQIRQFEEKTDLSMRQFSYNTRFQSREMGVQRDQQLTQRGWQQRDMNFNRGVAGMEFGWQMEDADRNIRYSRGKQRVDLMREKERDVTRFGLQEGQRNVEQDRFGIKNKWEDQLFGREKERFEQGVKFQQEEFALQRRHFFENMLMDDKQLKMREAAHAKQLKWIGEERVLEDQSRLLTRQFQKNQQETQLQFAAAQSGMAIRAQELNTAIQGYGLAAQVTNTAVQTSTQGAINLRNVNTEVNNIMSQIILKFPEIAKNLDKELDKLRTVRVGSGSTGGGIIVHSQYADGGYTGTGGKHEAAGVVHKGEWVVPTQGALVLRGTDNALATVMGEVVSVLKEIRDQKRAQVNAYITTRDRKVSVSSLVDEAYAAM